jgi:hypothetical protein
MLLIHPGRYFAACLLALLGTLLAAQARADVDLGIADDETFKRPNSWSKLPHKRTPIETVLDTDGAGPASRPGISIAWRNAEQVEEVEVRVRNLGSDPGEGRVYVDVLDERGKLLLHLDPPEDQAKIRVPAADRGGREGKVLRMKAHRDLNTLIDSYDRTRTRYDVRATVETVGPDKNPFDNVKVKSFNIPFAVRPGFLNVYNYIYKNQRDKEVQVKWQFEHTPYPPGWEIKGAPVSREPFGLKPGQEIVGHLTMLAPDKIEENAFLEARLSLVDVASGQPLQQHEWFQVYDTEPPHVSNYRLVLTADHHVAIQALVADRGSGVLEATGVVTEFSTNGGRTWAGAAHNYKNGNFVQPTLFEAVIGPFAPGTKVQLRFRARDTAGNSQTVIPDDATGLEAPPAATKLLQRTYPLPRTQPSPLFDLPDAKKLRSGMKELGLTETDVKELESAKPIPLNRVQAPGQELLKMTTLEVTVK